MKKEVSYKTASPDIYELLKTFARYNRKELTKSEEILWNALRRYFRSYRFRRQHPIGDYIADFVCLPLKLVIEVDGGYHNSAEQQQLDSWRTEFLQSKGYTVLRFSNEQVNTHTEDVLKEIEKEVYNIEDNYD